MNTLVVIAIASLPSASARFLEMKDPCSLSSLGCPGSATSQAHAACSESLVFSDSCKAVQEEIQARIALDDDRKKLPGLYKLISSVSGTCTKGSRATSPFVVPGPFTDLFGFVYHGSGSTCTVSACSESQVPSECDFSTNFCNLYNLYCNAADGCVPLLYNLTYSSVKFGKSCDHGAACGGWENKPAQCTRR